MITATMAPTLANCVPSPKANIMCHLDNKQVKNVVFLPGRAKTRFLAYITQGPKKNGICQENGIGNVFELSEIAETCFGAFTGFWLLVALFLEIRWCPICQNDRLSW